MFVSIYLETITFKGNRVRAIILRDLTAEFRLSEHRKLLFGQEKLTEAVTLNLKTPQALI